MTEQNKLARRRKIRSPQKQKILLLLSTGLQLVLTRSSKSYLRIVGKAKREWEKVERRYLHRIIQEFKNDRLVNWFEKEDGTIKITISEKGKHQLLQFDVDKMQISEPKQWDRKWRVVFFDVPEKKRLVRDSLRFKLQNLGFYELQKSVFVHPYPCTNEINFIVEFFEARPHVRLAELSNPTNEAELLLHFDYLKLKR